MVWNCNGISNKIEELSAFIKLHNISIVLLGETRLNPKSQIKIPNFHTYRTDRPSIPRRPQTGGTAILIRRGIVHHQEIIQTRLDSTTIYTKLGNDIVQISAVYNSPGATLETRDLDLLTNHRGPFVIAGDLNAKHGNWHSILPNKAGKTLARHQESYNLYSVVASESPTHYPFIATHRPNILDIALINLPPHNYTLSNINDLSSDHNPQIIGLNSSPITNGPPYSRKIINWKKFEHEITHHLKNKRINSIHDIDQAIDKLTSSIQAVLEKCSHIPNTPKIANPISGEIALEIETKRILRKEWQRTRYPVTKKLYYAQIAYVKKLLKDHRQASWDKFTATLNFKDKSIYKLNNRLLRKTPPSQPLKAPDGSKIFDNHLKTELFADAMETQFKNNPGSQIPEVTEAISSLNQLNTQMPTDYVSPLDVWNTIKKLSPRKAPGHDQITNKALKHLPQSASTIIANIFTACLRLSYFPKSWKRAVIIMIPKPKKDHMIPNNHRPISLLTSLSKIFEKLILTRLKIHISPRCEQHAFRSGHSTTTQLVTLIDDLSSNHSNKDKTAAIFLDIEKAFDRVWHEALLYKLIHTGVPTYIVKIVKSFLHDRSFLIKISNSLSKPRNIEAGVPQGSCLSPLLYVLYINDLPTSPQTKVALFADDTMFYAHNKNYKYAVARLQRQLNLASDWMSKWRIRVNVSKTVAVIFGLTTTNQNVKLVLQGQTIDWSTHAKYLGVILDQKLNMNRHIHYTIQRARGARAALYPILNKNSPLPLATKVAIFKIYIKPIILYASPTWRHKISYSNWTKLEAIQSVALRTMTGAHYLTSNQNLRNSVRINTLYDDALHQSKVLAYKLTLSKFPHLNRLTNSS